jgi:hypothetical protein
MTKNLGLQFEHTPVKNLNYLATPIPANKF